MGCSGLQHLPFNHRPLAIDGVLAGELFVQVLASIWLAHIGFDRAIGYGLKYPSDFRDTHLGRIGQAKE